MNNNKLPPHNIDAEEAVIGSVVVGGEISRGGLTASDFYTDACRLIYSAAIDVAAAGAKPNLVTIAQRLKELGELEQVGGSAYLVHCETSTATHLDLENYADIVRKLSLYRQLIQVGEKIIDMGYNPNGDAVKTMDIADNLLLDVRKRAAPAPVVTPRDRAEKLYARYEKLKDVAGGMALSTGLVDLDRALGGGLYSGDLFILAARTSMGKTTLAQFIANGVADRGGRVLFCSGEMSVDAVSDRDVAGLVGEPIWRVRLGNYDDDLYSRIVGALGEISERQVYYYESMPMTVSGIAQAALSTKLRHGLDLVVVDYIGTLDDESPRGGWSQNERLGLISKKLKQAARALDVPVIALHQLNRQLEQREDKCPELYDLRESGHLEEDADEVVFLYRPDYYWDADEWREKWRGNHPYYKDTYPAGIVEIIIAKQRQGQTGVVRVLYDQAHQIYKNLLKEGDGQMPKK